MVATAPPHDARLSVGGRTIQGFSRRERVAAFETADFLTREADGCEPVILIEASS